VLVWFFHIVARNDLPVPSVIVTGMSYLQSFLIVTQKIIASCPASVHGFLPNTNEIQSGPPCPDTPSLSMGGGLIEDSLIGGGEIVEGLAVRVDSEGGIGIRSDGRV